MEKKQNKIVIVDFGSQTCHLIGRRVGEMGTGIEIVEPEQALEKIEGRM